METRVFAFEIGNLWPSQLNSFIDAACWDRASAMTAWKQKQIKISLKEKISSATN